MLHEIKFPRIAFFNVKDRRVILIRHGCLHMWSLLQIVNTKIICTNNKSFFFFFQERQLCYFFGI